MRKGLMSAVIVFGLAVGVSAAQGDPGVDFGLRAGYQRFSEEGDGSFLGGLFLRVPWRSVILSEGAILYHRRSARGGDAEVIPVQLSAMLFFLRRDMAFSPYLLGGLGLYINRFVPDEGDSESKWKLGWHLGVGADYMLNDRVFAELDFRYIWLDVDFSGQTVGDKLSNFDNWMGTAGIGFRL